MTESGAEADRLSSRWLWGLVGVSAVAAALLFWRLSNLDATLHTASDYDILDFEFAWTADRAQAIRDSWPTEGQPMLWELARRSLHLDFLFILAYGLLYLGLGVLAVRQMQEGARRSWHWLIAFPIVAMLLDCGENVGLLWILHGEGRPSGTVVGLTSSAAAIKFLLLLVTSLPLLIIGIVRGRRFIQRRLPGDADPSEFAPPHEVFEREAQYLKSRRAKVPHLDPEFAQHQQAIGLSFSGGGIRSATVCLGALQALCRRKILPKIDYLSTVSGGGYIGSALSSLLSIHQDKLDHSAVGDEEQYDFSTGGEPYFTTEPERFAFGTSPQELNADFNGSAQVDHLRTHGDFLILRRSLIHRDVLRTVGAVLSGLFYHLLLFILLLLTLAGFYLAILHAMAGPFEITSLGSYWNQLVGPLRAPSHPFWIALVVGSFYLPLAMLVISRLVWGRALPDHWFRRGQESLEENREYHSLWALLYLTLLAAITVTALAVHAKDNGPDVSYILLPMGVYLGGWVSTLALHAVVAINPVFDRNSRSRFAAWKGIYDYLTIASIIVVFFPFVIRWFREQPQFMEIGGTGWLLSLVGTWLLSRGGGAEAPTAMIKSWTAKLMALSGSVRRFLLGIVVTGVIVMGFLWICALILELEQTWRGWDVWSAAQYVGFRLAVGATFLALFVLLGFLLDFNKLSLHHFYRDRLVEAYLQTVGPAASRSDKYHRVEDALDTKRDNAEMPLTRLHGSIEPITKRRMQDSLADYYQRILPRAKRGGAQQSADQVRAATSAPYHLLVTCLNLTRSRDLRLRNRRSDVFVFSKLYCGSHTTGYMETRRYRSGATKLAAAMTISGAAVSPAIGSGTFFAQAFATSLFNVRLGQWMENPAYRDGASAHRRENLVFWPYYLVKEMLGAASGDDRLVYLSDGGHTGDNLGLGPLLQRRCRLILAVDAECDPELSFGSLNQAIRQASIDREVKQIDIHLESIRPRPDSGRSQRHVAVGRIDYVGGQKGWLVVLKASLTGDESEPIKGYQRFYKTFPQQTTADQFFDDAQFESYRDLGQHLTTQAFERELHDALAERDWQSDWNREFEELEA